MTKQTTKITNQRTDIAHDMAGRYLHTVHEVSIESTDLRIADELEKQGWTYSRGWYRGTTHMRVYQKAIVDAEDAALDKARREQHLHYDEAGRRGAENLRRM